MCNRFVNRLTLTGLIEFSALLGADFAADATLTGGEYFPDQDVPILRQEGRQLTYRAARWGLPPIPGDKEPITNIRNLQSPWWREQNRDLCQGTPHRCLVPFSVFAEPARDSHWFEPQIQPPMIACFAGFWQPWRGERLQRLAGQKRRVRQMAAWELFGFLTTTANAIVAPVHDTMPVILTAPDQMLRWLGGGTDSLSLQAPLPEAALHKVDAPTGRTAEKMPDTSTQGTLF